MMKFEFAKMAGMFLGAIAVVQVLVTAFEAAARVH
jgi:hypothetical protein